MTCCGSSFDDARFSGGDEESGTVYNPSSCICFALNLLAACVEQPHLHHVGEMRLHAKALYMFSKP
jgi:hypothetical protein